MQTVLKSFLRGYRPYFLIPVIFAAIAVSLLSPASAQQQPESPLQARVSDK